MILLLAAAFSVPDFTTCGQQRVIITDNAATWVSTLFAATTTMVPKIKRIE